MAELDPSLSQYAKDAEEARLERDRLAQKKKDEEDEAKKKPAKEPEVAAASDDDRVKPLGFFNFVKLAASNPSAALTYLQSGNTFEQRMKEEGFAGSVKKPK
jgi:hypothetical protein